MSFRERAVWIALILHLSVLAVCGFGVLGALTSGATGWVVLANLPIIAFLLTTFFSRAVIEAVTRRVPGTDAKMPPDERDRAIETRSVSMAYRILLGGLLLVGSLTLKLYAETTPSGSFGQTAEAVVTARELGVVSLNVIYFSAAAAELTRWVTKLVLYRRQG